MTLAPPDLRQINLMAENFGMMATVFTSIRSVKDLAYPENDSKELQAEDEAIVKSRQELVDGFKEVGELFKASAEKGANVARRGSLVAGEWIYDLERIIAKDPPEELADLANGLIAAVKRLLKDATDMQHSFSEVSIGLAVLAGKQKAEAQRIEERTVDLKEDIKTDKKAIKGVGLAAVGMGIGAVAFWPLAVPAALTAAFAGIGVGVMRDRKKSLAHKEDYTSFLDVFGDVVKKAEGIAEEQVNYWSKTLKALIAVHDGSEFWVEKPVSIAQSKRLLSQWKTIGEAYDSCHEKATQASRHMEAHMRITN